MVHTVVFFSSRKVLIVGCPFTMQFLGGLPFLLGVILQSCGPIFLGLVPSLGLVLLGDGLLQSSSHPSFSMLVTFP